MWGRHKDFPKSTKSQFKKEYIFNSILLLLPMGTDQPWNLL